MGWTLITASANRNGQVWILHIYGAAFYSVKKKKNAMFIKSHNHKMALACKLWLDLIVCVSWVFWVLCSLIGQFCTEDVNECDLMPNSCQNGGTCLNTQGGYTCVCVNGWSGDDCSKNIDDCVNAACHLGSTCHDRVASFFCECPPGRTGLYFYTCSPFSFCDHL